MTGDRSDGRERALPAWFSLPLVAVLCTLTVFMLVGLGFAMAGAFLPLPVVLTSAVVSVLALRRILPAVPRGPVTRGTHVVVGIVVLGSTLVAAYNVSNHAEHLVVNRDPGIYLTTARWLAAEGDLRVERFDETFGDASVVFASVPGFSSPDADPNYPQFPHGLPVVLAGAGWLDAALILVLNPVIASLALLCVFAAGVQAMRPFWAAAATGMLAATFPFVFMARDTYSEPLATVLLFGGLWLLALRGRPRPALGAMTGVLLGAVCVVRIDGLVSLIPVAAVLALWLRHARRQGDRARVRSIAATAAGALATTGYGLVDTRFFSPDYFRGDLEPRLWALLAAIGAATVAGYVLAPLFWEIDEPRWRPRSLLRGATLAAGFGLAGALTWMATVRPAASGVPELASEVTGRLIDLQDQVGTLSYRWQEFYLGRPGTALGFLGLLGLTGAALLRGRDAAPLALPGVILSTTMLYLVSPNITPDQVWAMRRFVAITIPGLLLGAMWLAGRVWQQRHGRLRLAGPVLALGIVAVTAVPVAETTSPLRSVRIGHPSHALVDSICELATAEPSAVLVADEGLLNFTMPMTIRSWCGVPAAGAATELGDDVLTDMAARWADEGRRLLVLSASGEAVDRSIRDTVYRLHPAALAEPEVTLTREPRALVPDHSIVKAPGGVLRLQLIEVSVETSDDRS